MNKDFNKWGNLKKIIDSGYINKFFHQREVWWCYLGLNIGSEQNGGVVNFQRPVLILKKFNGGTLLVAPITSKTKKNIFYYSISPESQVILSQIRLISSKRLTRKISIISRDHYRDILNKLVEILYK